MFQYQGDVPSDRLQVQDIISATRSGETVRGRLQTGNISLILTN